MPLTQQKHNTVEKHNTQKHTHQICEYATDSYEAIEHAKEDVPYLKEHPHFVDYCTNNSGLDYLMGIVPMGR